MALEHRTDVVEEAVLSLAPPFWGRPRVAAMVVGPALQLQELEDVFWDIYESRLLDNATGARLDILGKLVGAPRRNIADDDLYRLVIKTRIRANRSSGTRPDLRAVLELLGFGQAKIRTDWPAGVLIILPPANSALETQVIADLVAQAATAGVSVVVFAGQDEALTMGNVNDPTVGTDLGDATNPGSGAPLTYVVHGSDIE